MQFIASIEWSAKYQFSALLKASHQKKITICNLSRSSDASITTAAFRYKHCTPTKTDLLQHCHDAKYYIAIGAVTLFNRCQLQSQLTGMSRKQHATDMSLAVAAYQKWGKGCLAHLTGNFSFLIYDKKESRVFCAVDHFNTIPCFFFYQPGHSLIVSSNIAAIRTIHPSIQDLNHSFLIDHLTYKHSPESSTPFQSVQRLPAAHSMTISKSKLQQQQYWDFTNVKQRQCHNKGGWSEELQHLLRECVRERIGISQKTGILLSGGLDSSAITCLSAELIKEGLLDHNNLCNISKIFSKTFSGKNRSETKHIEKIAKETGVKTFYCNEEILSPLNFSRSFYNDNHRLPASAFWAITTPLLRIAESQSIQTLLTGFGGDELASMHGDNIFPLLFKQGKILKLLTLLKEHQNIYQKNIPSLFRSMIFAQFLPRPWMAAYRKFKYPDISKLESLSFLHPDIEHLELRKRYNKQGIIDTIPLETQKRIKHQIFNSYFQSLLADNYYNAEKYGHTRLYPLLDKKLVEFFAIVPAEELIKNGWERSLFRRALKGVLPSQIRWRKDKCLFNISYLHYIRNGSEIFEEMLSNKNSSSWELLDRAQIRFYFDLVMTSPEKVQHIELLCGKLATIANVGSFIQWIENN